jgi:sugar/nucleoside kinase (ribokinase family)
MANDIIVAGPTYLDHTIRVDGILSLDGSRRIAEEYKDAGGTGLCYGVALARQGNPTTLFSAIGNDEAAERIMQIVNKEAHLRAVWQHNSPTSDYAILFVDDGNHKCVASRKDTSDTWRPDAGFMQQAAKSKSVVITSFANVIALRILRNLAKLGSQKPFVMWAPHFGNCANARILESVLPAIDHITLSQEEYDRLHQEIGDPTARGVTSVTITSGKEGVTLIKNGKSTVYKQIVSIENPLDTNGAGEAFGAGFLTALLQTGDYEQAVLAGSFVGALQTERRGSDFPRVTVTPPTKQKGTHSWQHTNL